MTLTTRIDEVGESWKHLDQYERVGSTRPGASTSSRRRRRQRSFSFIACSIIIILVYVWDNATLVQKYHHLSATSSALPESLPPEEEAKAVAMTTTKLTKPEALETVTKKEEEAPSSTTTTGVATTTTTTKTVNSQVEEVVKIPLHTTLQRVTDMLEEAKLHSDEIEIIKQIPNDEYTKYPVFGTIKGMFDDYCYKNKNLENTVFRECQQNMTPKQLAELQPCTKGTYIAKVGKNGTGAFIDGPNVHGDVPGTVYTQEKYYASQFYVRNPKLDWTTTNMPTIISKYDQLAHVLQAYPTAYGHFPHETLPRLVWLLEVLPQDVPILVSRTSFVDKFLHYLESIGKLTNMDRIIPYDSKKIYYAKQGVYFANEYPYCNSNPSPHKGGTTSYFPKSMLNRVRTVFTERLLPSKTEIKERNVILVMKRKQGSIRSIMNHNELISALEKMIQGTNDIIKIFDTPSTKLQDDITLFQSAKIVIGPHGAGFANILWCQPQTTIIEVGYNTWHGSLKDGRGSGESMSLDHMYYFVANGLSLDYWLLLGQGSYNTPMKVNVNDVITILSGSPNELERMHESNILPVHSYYNNTNDKTTAATVTTAV